MRRDAQELVARAEGVLGLAIESRIVGREGRSLSDLIGEREVVLGKLPARAAVGIQRERA